VTKIHFADEVMPSPPPAGDDGPRLNSRGLTWELVMSTGMRARMATMLTRNKKHCKLMMDQRRMWRTEGIVLESVMIGWYISDMQNTILAKQMQRHGMYPK
jgi:hypothetical protein